MAEVLSRRSPLSFTPGRFSRRKECRLAGRALRVRLVKEVAGSPDKERFLKRGSCLIVPMIARNVKGIVFREFF